MKKCNKCLIDKDLCFFYKDKHGKNGTKNSCIECEKQRVLLNKEKIKQTQRNFYIRNKEKILQQTKDYKLKNKDKIKEKNKKYLDKNKDKIKEKRKEHYLNNIEKERQRKRKYRQLNKEKIKIKSKQKTDALRKKDPEKYRKVLAERMQRYRKKNKEKHLNYFSNYIKEYSKKRRKQDVKYRLSCVLRTRLYNALKGNFKSGSAVRDLGCSIEELKIYLESKFQEGMSWENYGFYGWHIDHIIPLASFDLTDPEQFKKACHYTNLQPLWATDNLKKNDKTCA